MSENTIKFTRQYDGDTFEMVLSNKTTWIELSENYLKFLKGCGYYVEAKDLADYFSEMVEN